MKRLFALMCALVLSMPAAVPALAKDHQSGNLDMYAVTVDAATAAQLLKAGYDIADSELAAGDTVTLSIVLSPKDRNQLARQGIDATLIRDSHGKSSRERAVEQAAAGFTVWRSWDQRGGIRDELYDIAKKNAGFVKLEVLGTTSQGREIIALKVTQGAKGQPDGSRPAAMFMSNQHAR